MRVRGGVRCAVVLVAALVPASARADAIVVTSSADSGPGSLRQAITDANRSASPVGIDLMAGLGRIRLQSPLPPLRTPGGIGPQTLADPHVELDGSAAGPGADGIVIEAPDAGVSGMRIHGFGGDGILVADAPGAQVTDDELFDNGGAGVRFTGGSDSAYVWNDLMAENHDGVVIGGGGGDQPQRVDVTEDDITGNAGMAIDLGDDGPTPNDPLDADAGANGLQNAPVLTSAVISTAEFMPTEVSGTIDAAPNTGYTLNLSGGDSCAAWGHGAKDSDLNTYLPIYTDAAGHATFTEEPVGAEEGDLVTATITGPNGTSEQSNCVEIRQDGTHDLSAAFDDGQGVVVGVGQPTVVNASEHVSGTGYVRHPVETITLGDGLVFDATPLGTECTTAGSVLTCGNDPASTGISSGGFADSRFTVTATRAGTFPIVARVTTPTADSDPADDVAVFFVHAVDLAPVQDTGAAAGRRAALA